MSYFPGMQKGNLDSVKSDEHGKIKKETVSLQGVSVTRVTFDVGAKWSNDLKDYAGTDSCPNCHMSLSCFLERSGSSWTMARNKTSQGTTSCCCHRVTMRGPWAMSPVCSSNSPVVMTTTRAITTESLPL